MVPVKLEKTIFMHSMYILVDQVINVKCDLLFSRDVTLTYRGAVHFSHLHVILNLSELQSQVLTTDSHERAALPGTPEGGDLLNLNVDC